MQSVTRQRTCAHTVELNDLEVSGGREKVNPSFSDPIGALARARRWPELEEAGGEGRWPASEEEEGAEDGSGGAWRRR